MAIKLYDPMTFPQLSQDGDLRRFLTGELAKISASIRSISGQVIRTRLTGTTQFYIRGADGNDANNGLTNSSSGAWKTLQGGLNALRDRYDADGNIIQVNVTGPAATFTEDVVLPWVVGGPIGGVGTNILMGDETTPANVTMNGMMRSLGASQQWYVSGFNFTNTNVLSTGTCVSGHANGWIRLGKVNFGAANGTHVAADHRGAVEFMQNYSINGAAPNHVLCQFGGYVLWAGISPVVTLSGTLNFSSFAFVSDNSLMVNLGPASFTGGTITGQRYILRRGSGVNAGGGGVNLFPGNVAGTADAATYCWYV